MIAHRYQIDASRVSVLTAAVLLAFALTRVISTPYYSINIPLAGIALTFSVNLNTAIAILAAGLSASGVDWLLRAHPSLEPGETVEHWLLPMLTTLVIGVTLDTLPSGLIWWLGFGLGGILLVVVFLAEYVAVEPADARYPLAMAALTALSFAIYLILTIALRSAGVRLFLLAPALFLVGGLAALRTLHLRLNPRTSGVNPRTSGVNERWEFGWALGIALVGVQLAAALHYWPLTPVRFGLILLGPAYALTGLAANLAEGNPFRRAFAEPAVMLFLLWGLVIWFR
ncbi:MAG: hypothetical protein QMD04_07660 [Anaerolineales bacterium]|nr:hypothetical protein [Anaerolineales bacterium]